MYVDEQNKQEISSVRIAVTSLSKKILITEQGCKSLNLNRPEETKIQSLVAITRLMQKKNAKSCFACTSCAICLISVGQVWVRHPDSSLACSNLSNSCGNSALQGECLCSPNCTSIYQPNCFGVGNNLVPNGYFTLPLVRIAFSVYMSVFIKKLTFYMCSVLLLSHTID